jgi:hypothetical protein
MNIILDTEYIIIKDVFAGGYLPSTIEKVSQETVKAEKTNFIAPARQFNLFSEMPLAQDQMRRGTCATFAISRVAEYLHEQQLSEQHLYNMAYHYYASPDPNIEGTTLEAVCEPLKRQGVCLEEIWQYYGENTPNNFPQDPVPDKVKQAVKTKISSYRSVEINSSKKAIEICNLIYNLNAPLVISIPIFWQVCGWETGDFIETPPNGTPVGGHHAICIFGYDMDLRFLIMQNSWGTDWGTLGTACISFEYIDKYLDDLFILEK